MKMLMLLQKVFQPIVGHICRKIIDGLRDKSSGSVIEKCEKVTGATKVTQQCQDYGAQRGQTLYEEEFEF